MLVHFIDDRDPCIALFWRSTEHTGHPYVVCLRPPFDLEKLHTDKDLTACKLSQVKSFSEIKNESGGNLLTYVNRYIKESAIFKQHKVDYAAKVIALGSPKDAASGFSARAKLALNELELRVRRSQNTRRAREKEPVAVAEKENQEAELAKMREELGLLKDLEKDLEALGSSYNLPVSQRFLCVQSYDLWKADIAAVCASPMKKNRPQSIKPAKR